MTNLVISPSQQSGIEEQLMRPMAQMLYDKIKSDNVPVNLMLIPELPGTDNEALKRAVDYSNEFIRNNGGTGYHLELHADAGNYATGASGLYVSEAGRKFITPIAKRIMDITPWNDVGIKQCTDLYALNQTIAVAGLLEVSFYDDPEEYNWMKSNFDLITETIKYGIYEAVGVTVYINWKQKYFDMAGKFMKLSQEALKG